MLQVILYVQSLAESAAFYNEVAGLTLATPAWDDLEGSHWAVLKGDGFEIALHPGPGGGTTALSFFVVDLESERQRLDKLSPSDIVEPYPRVKFFTLKDPDGTVIFIKPRQG